MSYLNDKPRHTRTKEPGSRNFYLPPVGERGGLMCAVCKVAISPEEAEETKLVVHKRCRPSDGPKQPGLIVQGLSSNT